MDGCWIFFSQNFLPDTALDFGVMGNLGADADGGVNAFSFSARPWKGFVKSTCGSTNPNNLIATRDPSVNHLIVVDGGESSGFVPHHSCGDIDAGAGLACQGSDPNHDDDWVSNIGPGSTILYLVYASVDSYCPTETEHKAVFDAAIACIFAEGARAAGEHCQYATWAGAIQSLVPDPYAFSSMSSDTSGDGATVSSPAIPTTP